MKQRDRHLSAQITDLKSLYREKQTLLEKKRDNHITIQNKLGTEFLLLESKKHYYKKNSPPQINLLMS